MIADSFNYECMFAYLIVIYNSCIHNLSLILKFKKDYSNKFILKEKFLNLKGFKALIRTI